jgi:hypothetical protein
MKVILGMLAHNDAFLLPRILPLLMPYFDHTVVGYSESTDDTKEILDATNAIVAEIAFSNNWAEARNAVIKVSEHIGGSYLLMLDSDEAMLKSDLDMLRLEFGAVGSMAMAFLYPRYEFVDDFEHYDPSLYPDYQARGFPLGQEFYYSGATHEQLCREGKVCSRVNGGYLKSKRHVFHYGKCKPTAEVALKYHNYDRLKNGLELVKELPPGFVIPETWAPGHKTKFEGPKPW